MKKIIKILKINIKGGNANPSPPLGPSLGAIGVNIMDFCKKFNKETKNRKDENLFIRIIIFVDKSFQYIIKKPTITNSILNILNKEKGSNEPNKKKIGKININNIIEIAKEKMSDLNCFNIKSAVSMIIGSLKSIGVEIEYNNEKKN
ncbi:MAG: 50S ribosomal protein L11 [Candidatus Shikimatogenerans sp. JK-2022]|nr:50S ribosomal protein L11 [Candidatus Shikimatogenerans bostrichidophilus]